MSSYVSAEQCKYLSLLCLAFPAFLLFTLGMLFVMLLVNRRRAWIPFLGLLLCSPVIYDYFPINVPLAPPKQSLKVMTFNTHHFGRYEDDLNSVDADGNNVVVKFLMAQTPDLVGYQEGLSPKLYDKFITPLIRKHGYYADSVSFCGNRLGCFSRLPIVGKDVLCQRGGNGAAVFKLLDSAKDTVFFIVAHLQTLGFNSDNRKVVGDKFSLTNVLNIARKMAHTDVPRSQQADSIAQFIERHADRKVIVCGDFNATPVSYPYHAVSGAASMSDAFVDAGNGLGRTFNQYDMVVRIDHIFYNATIWRPYATRIHSDEEYSDHYAVTTYLREI